MKLAKLNSLSCSLCHEWPSIIASEETALFQLIQDFLDAAQLITDL
jgi:hypothetical protein